MAAKEKINLLDVIPCRSEHITVERRCVVIHDAPSFFSLTIKIGSFSLSCDILRISLVYVFATSK